MEMYELMARYDARKSFYGKAHVMEDENGKTLLSYGTKICRIDNDGNLSRLWHGNSQTTTRHVKEFLKQFGGNYEEYRRA